MRLHHVFVIAAFVIAGVGMASSLSAETCTWTGLLDNNWDTAENWDTITVPGASDIAWIAPGTAATVDMGGQTRYVSDAVLGNCTLQNGTLNVAAMIHLQNGAVVNANLANSSGGRMWIDYGGTVTLGGDNAVTYVDHVSAIIGYAGSAPTVKLATANGLNAATEMTDVYSGTLDLNGQGTIRTGGIRLVGGANGALLTNTSENEAQVNAWIGLTTGSQIGGTGNIVLTGRLYDGAAGAQSLTKVGSDWLMLYGNNNYTGDTIVNGGVLADMDGTDLCDDADVRIASGATMGLNYTGTDTIRSLYFDGVMQAAGTWGSSTSGAEHVDDSFFVNGYSGMVNVLVGVPEPSTLAMTLAAVLGLVAYAWRKRK